MKRKRQKAQQVQGHQFAVLILCCDPSVESLVSQLLPSDLFVVKSLPSHDVDLFIVEEGLLNESERQILRALAEFGTLKAVADHLHYHPTTVKRYLCRIYKKLKVKTAPQATALATKLGLI